MKLARNAVFAVKNSVSNEVMSFLYVNKDDLINPFWINSFSKKEFSLFGELAGYEAGGDEHWRSVEHETCNVVMIQSHVTKAEDVDLKLCLKLAQNK